MVTIGWPIVRLVALSFQRATKKDVIFAHDTSWVGFENYRKTLKDPAFWQMAQRSTMFAIGCVAATMLLGVVVALVMTRMSTWVRILVSIGLILAWATPNFIAATLWRWMFDPEFGVINYALTRTGLCECQHHSWTAIEWQAFLYIGVIIVWQAVPFIAIAVYGALLTVPAELGESARMDGASGWTVFWRITAPMIRPVLALLTVLSVIWDFRVFPQVWFSTRGDPGGKTLMLGPYIFQKATGSGQYGLASAIAVITTILLLGLSYTYMRTMRREAT